MLSIRNRVSHIRDSPLPLLPSLFFGNDKRSPIIFCQFSHSTRSKSNKGYSRDSLTAAAHVSFILAKKKKNIYIWKIICAAASKAPGAGSFSTPQSNQWQSNESCSHRKNCNWIHFAMRSFTVFPGLWLFLISATVDCSCYCSRDTDTATATRTATALAFAVVLLSSAIMCHHSQRPLTLPP